jgi:L-ascorbate metabolism protein UlaG (beta-lactamase superfamily)
LQIRYIANACFILSLASGKTILTDPWFEGPCQQTWWNFPPLDPDLLAEVRGLRPDYLYISHLHHDHLHPQSLAHFDPATPVIVGAMNTPNLATALKSAGFSNLMPFAFETRTPLPGAGCELVLFRDFHGNTLGDDSVLDYDLDTSIYLFDGDGARVFNAVDNTIRPEDAARIASEYGAPDAAMLPYASASLYPMAMADYNDDAKMAACERIRARTSANFAEVSRRLGPARVIPAGGEYVLGGSVADRSRFLPQPLEPQLRAALDAAGVAGERLAKLYPGDALDSATGAVTRNPKALMRDFSDADRAAYALSLTGRRETCADLTLPTGAEFEWRRAMAKAARNFQDRRRKLGLDLDMDIYVEALAGPARERMFLFKLALDSDAAGFCEAVGRSDRRRLAYRIDQKMLFCLLTGLLSWNAMEASALLEVRRDPDTYEHDTHRAIVHFTLLS